MNNDASKSNIPLRLSISEAAKLFGVSDKTIRQAIKNGEVVYIVVRGRYKINFDSLLKWSQQTKRRQFHLNNNGLGRYVDRWKITNKKFSPSPAYLKSNHKTASN